MTETTFTGAKTSPAKSKSLKRFKKLAPLEDTQLSSVKSNQHPLTKFKTIQHKKDLVEAVRRVAPATISTSPSLFRDVASNLKTTNIDDSDVRQQLSIVEDGVNGAARRYNDLRILNDRRARELKQKLDELESLRLEYDSMAKMKTRDTPQASRMDSLKIEITEVEDDIERLMHYRRQLEHMLTRLRRNQIKFDAHMNGMEETHATLKKEWEEVRLLRRALDSGLARAQLVLEETQVRVADARKERAQMLSVRKAELRNAYRLKSWMKDRAVVKMALATELRGDLTKEEEILLRTQLKEKEEKTKRLQRANEESQRKVSQMDEAFTKIKQITGMTSLDDMVDKFAAQRTNKKNLEKEVHEVEAKLAEAKKAYAKQETVFQEKKSSGKGYSEINRETTLALEEKIAASRYEYKITKAAAERLDVVLVALRQGAHSLLQRVQPYVNLVDAGVFELTSVGHGDETDSWTETMDALSTSEQVLSKMLEIIGGGEASPTKLGGTAGSVSEDAFESRYEDDDGGMTEAPSMTNNVRVRSRKTRREAEEVDHGFKPPDIHVSYHREDTGEDTDEDSSSYDNISGDRSPANMLGTMVTAVTNATTYEDTAAEGVRDAADEHELMTRNLVKRSSARTTQEAIRKHQIESRTKKLAERMQVAGGEQDEGGRIAEVAKHKAQVIAMQNLSAHHHPATLPEGVTIRDDPLKKTVAFLTKMPDLA